MKSKYKVETTDGTVIATDLTLQQADAVLNQCFAKGQAAHIGKDAPVPTGVLTPHRAFYAYVPRRVIEDAGNLLDALVNGAQDEAMVHICDEHTSAWMADALGVKQSDLLDAFVVLYDNGE